jgi:hypothetical protein
MNNEDSKGAEADESAGFEKSLLATSRTPLPKRPIALLVLLSAMSVLFAIQVDLDVTHLRRVSLELTKMEVRTARDYIYAQDRKLMEKLSEMDRNKEILDELSDKPRTDADMELRAISRQSARLNDFLKEKSRLLDQKTAKISDEISDYLKRVYSDEEKYSRILILVDSVWLIIATISAIAAFKRLAFAIMSARLFAGLTLLCALARVCASAAGTKDGYFNLLIWPLSMCSLGNSVFWPAAIMFLWSGVLLGLTLKGSDLQDG